MPNQNMKLIYCTSLFFPSALADRCQILAMSKALAQKLGADFYLGVSDTGTADSDIKRLQQSQVIEFGRFKSWRLAWQYLKFIKKNKIEYVYCREPRLLLFLISFSKLFLRFRPRFIYEVHLLLERSFLDRVVEWLVSRWSDYFIFITKHLAALYIKRYHCPEGSSLVAPDAVDLDIFDLEITKEQARQHLGLPQDKKIIGFFGRFRTMGKEKGIETILSSLRLLPQDVVFLAMGGKPRDREYYHARAEELGVGNRVIFVESLSQEDVAFRQKACDILLMPYPNTQHYGFYMSPLKMFEYMASKRPIIASDLPSVREVLSEKNAFFVKPAEPEDLARVIEEVLANKELAESKAQQAYLDVHNYTWQKRVEKIIDFIRN
jgi:glycosyltransferase involved in cell wall biosynthesis